MAFTTSLTGLGRSPAHAPDSPVAPRRCGGNFKNKNKCGLTDRQGAEQNRTGVLHPRLHLECGAVRRCRSAVKRLRILASAAHLLLGSAKMGMSMHVATSHAAVYRK